MEPQAPPDGVTPGAPPPEPLNPQENPVIPELNQEKIVAPFNFKKIGVFFLNIILFFIYFFLLSFFVGIIIGISGLLIGSGFIDSESVKNIGAFIAFVLLIIITLIFRKKIYLKVVKT